MSNSLAVTPGGLPWTLKYTIDSHVKVYYRPTIIIVKSLSTWQSTRFGSKSPLTTPDSVSQSDSRQWNSFAQFITKPEQIRLHKTINPKTTTSYCWSFEQSKVYNLLIKSTFAKRFRSSSWKSKYILVIHPMSDNICKKARHMFCWKEN